MENKDSHEKFQSRKSENEKSPQTTYSPNNTIAVYTALSILLKMRAILGLEAMLEYIGKYLSEIEAHNPEMKYAVVKALQLVSVEKIYLDLIKNGKS